MKSYRLNRDLNHDAYIFLVNFTPKLVIIFVHIYYTRSVEKSQIQINSNNCLMVGIRKSDHFIRTSVL